MSKKNTPGSQLAAKRWENKTPEQKADHARMMSRAYWDSCTPAQKADHVARMHAGLAEKRRNLPKKEG